MAKRVKKGLSMRLPGSGACRVFAKEHNGMLRLEDESPTSYDTVDLTAAQCEFLGMTDVLEDVPEPWERVRDAWFTAAQNEVPDRIPASTKADEAIWRHMADALGIKPEGE